MFQPPISDICVSQNRVYSANGKHDDIFFRQTHTVKMQHLVEIGTNDDNIPISARKWTVSILQNSGSTSCGNQGNELWC